MQYYFPDKFNQEILPQLIQDKKEMVAVFATYNEVSNYSEGEIETGKEGLKIHVQSGNLGCDFGAMGTLLGAAGIMYEDSRAIKLAERILDNEYENADTAQNVVENKFHESTKTLQNENIIIYIYAGLTAWQRVFYFIEQIRNIKEFKNKNVIIVVVICDCEFFEKKELLEPLLEKNIIQYVVMTEICGGRMSMKTLLEGLKEAW
jgi:hypothetical protein